MSEALKNYASIVAIPTEGVASLVDKAMPAITANIKPSTEKQYSYCARIIKETFVEFLPQDVTHGTVVQMMDMWRDSPATANRLLTVLKLVFQWALDREIVDRNPCESVKRLPQKPRDRLITEKEYVAIYNEAPDWLQIIMDLCYLTGQRIGDVLKIEHAHITEDGIFFEQEKTGKQLIIGWTPELREVIDRAKKPVKNSVKSATYLNPGRAGTMRHPANVWRYFKQAAKDAGVENVTLHDLRAMSGTEAERQGINPTALLGHSDPRTTKAYLRDKTVKVVVGPRRKPD